MAILGRRQPFRPHLPKLLSGQVVLVTAAEYGQGGSSARVSNTRGAVTQSYSTAQEAAAAPVSIRGVIGRAAGSSSPAGTTRAGRGIRVSAGNPANASGSVGSGRTIGTAINIAPSWSLLASAGRTVRPSVLPRADQISSTATRRASLAWIGGGTFPAIATAMNLPIPSEAEPFNSFQSWWINGLVPLAEVAVIDGRRRTEDIDGNRTDGGVEGHLIGVGIGGVRKL